ncbi:MAG: hypothetical protein FWE15_20015, partial [Actinomycetia bacterium]|nr:hypothetical protein [Actinomycetes bacterium]
IRMGMELRWVRWMPRGLTCVTVYLNWHASNSMSGRLGHAALTLLWVAFSEIASHVYATRIGAATGKIRMESIRRSRWFLAPIPTARLRRRMILWEITSYSEALIRLQQQTVLRAQLREQYGWRWRSKAPLADRMALKLGSAPAELADALTPAADSTAVADDVSALTIDRADALTPGAHGDASASAPALTPARARSERERKALTAGAHEGERASASASGERADGGRSRSEATALTERRVTAIRVLAAKLRRRPTSAEIVSALVDAGLAEPDMSRPTAQRLRAQAETGAA